MSTVRENLQARLSAWNCYEEQRKEVLEWIEGTNQKVFDEVSNGKPTKETANQAVRAFVVALQEYVQWLDFARQAFPEERKGPLAARIEHYNEVLIKLKRVHEAFTIAMFNLARLELAEAPDRENWLIHYINKAFGSEVATLQGVQEFLQFITDGCLGIYSWGWEKYFNKDFLYRKVSSLTSMNEKSRRMAARVCKYRRIFLRGSERHRRAKLLEAQYKTYVCLAEFLAPKMRNGFRLANMDEFQGFFYWFVFTNNTRLYLDEKLEIVGRNYRDFYRSWYLYFRRLYAVDCIDWE